MTPPVPTLLDPEPLARRGTALLRTLGLAPGDRLATLLDNHPDALGLGLACALEGVVQVPLPSELPAREVAEIATDADPAAAVVEPAAPGTAGLPAATTIRELGTGGLGRLRPVEPSADWPTTRPMAYTSGTTGRRKGVSVGVRDPEWGRAVVEDEHAAFDRRHGERHLVVSPLYHSGPFRFALVTAVTGGRVAVLPRFSPEGLLTALRVLRPTSLFCVPTHLHRLLAHTDVTADDLASLSLLAHAGAPCPRTLKERVLDLAPRDSVSEFYGSTEGQFTICPPAVWRSHPGSVGHARPGRRLEVRDAHDAPVAPDTIGTVWVHAPWHARWEYWRDPERTAAAWDGEAFTVGDLGAVDADGVLTLHGRPGDLVVSGGVNVYPAEVERRLLEHPDVVEAVAFGVPDEDLGQRLVAAVVPWPGRRPDPDDLRAFTRQGLDGTRVPKRIVLVDELPRTPTGKVRRVGLAAALGVSP